MLDKILPHIGKPKRFAEPFVGAGSVYLNVEAGEYVLSDTNRDLITLYWYLMHDSEEYIRMASKLFNLENNTPEKYYELRKEFNETSDLAKKAELFLYLNKHAYNGLVRYNNSGELNSPFGKYSVVNFPENEIRFFDRETLDYSTWILRRYCIRVAMVMRYIATHHIYQVYSRQISRHIQNHSKQKIVSDYVSLL